MPLFSVSRVVKIMTKDNRLKIFIYLAILLTAGLIVFGVAFSRQGGGNEAGAPNIEASPAEYNAGTVSMKDGLVKYTYKIKNSGDKDLKINGIWTSCMCTAASLRVGDKKSPEFGMPGHQANFVGWSQTMSPGAEGELEVIFDPNAHGPEAVGEAVREIYISSNDPDSSQTKVRFIADVVK